jgi:hypothetical protein
LLQTLVVLAAVAGVLLTIWLIVRFVPRWERKRYRPARSSDLQQVPADVEPPLAGELSATFDVALAAFRAGDRERAIIACWIRLEQLAEAAGFARQSSETSTDLARRWLADLPLDPAALGQLAALYREARYSGHYMSDAAIDSARAALARLRAELDREEQRKA